MFFFFFGTVRYFLFLDSRSGRDNEVTDSTEYQSDYRRPLAGAEFSKRYVSLDGLF